jgi:hypothetical protein
MVMEGGGLYLMRSSISLVFRFAIALACLTSVTMVGAPMRTGGAPIKKAPTFHYAKDLSDVRGFNYNTSTSLNYNDEWLNYKHDEVDRDMGYAQRLNLNSARIFLSYTAWLKDRAAFREHLIDFVRTCNAHGIGAMLVLIDGPRGMMPDLFEESAKPKLREWGKDLYDAVGKEPGLAFWDVANEPDLIKLPLILPNTNQPQRIAVAKYMATVMNELDHRTPVTIGCLYLTCTQETASVVDVLSYHDYSQTRAQIHADIVRAQEFSVKVGKPLFNTEMACTGRANPYDIELEEHEKGHMGWYIWELMIAHYWGDIHGVFYPDGTVRDPAIVSALMGFYRNRGEHIVLEQADREGWVTRAREDTAKWLQSPNPDWFDGLVIAETSANILESNQLASMRELPTRRVDLLRAGKPDLDALRTTLKEFSAELAPYAKPGQAAAHRAYTPEVTH